MARPIGIDLFAGAGGLSLGFEWAGFDVAAAVEIDPVHSAVHEYNFPLCKTICADVSSIDGKNLLANAALSGKGVDVVFGGAPCQGFSLIGKRAIEDERNVLVYHFARLVKEIQPKYFVFENVKGLTVGKHKKFLEEVIELFEENGYRILQPYKVLNAADFGVPQNRERLFLMGARADVGLPSYPQATGSVTVRDAIGDLPEAEEFDELRNRDFVTATLGTASPYAMDLREETTVPFHNGYRRNYDRSVLTCSPRTEHSALSRARFQETLGGKTEPVSRYFKLDPEGVCNTIRAGTASDRGAFTSPRPIHPTTPRCITVREGARLHSYPDWFRFHSTKWHGFRQIGNSVPPKLGMAVASSIINALGVQATKPKKVLSLGNSDLLSLTMAQAAKHYSVRSDVIPKRTRKAA